MHRLSCRAVFPFLALLLSRFYREDPSRSVRRANNKANCTLWSSFPCWSVDSRSRKKIFGETPENRYGGYRWLFMKTMLLMK